MENTIDRKAYRRNSYNEYTNFEKKENKRSDNLLLNKIINALLLLLFILLLKFFCYEKEFEFIKNMFNEGYSYEYLESTIRAKIKKEDLEENINILIEDELSGDEKFISAVEGVNQLLDDAEQIKGNYKLILPLQGSVTSEFGCRVSDSEIVSSYHTGIDIASNAGNNICAAHFGKVIKAGQYGSYGNCVIIQDGNLKTLYAHCSKILVKEGEKVEMGANIAQVGMTGNATGPHLHFEIKYDERVVNPRDILEFGEK